MGVRNQALNERGGGGESRPAAHEGRIKMADDFFTKTTCDRCGKPLTVRTMSFFNTDAICPECAEVERKRPDFPAAHAAEVAAVKAGDLNFKGVGL